MSVSLESFRPGPERLWIRHRPRNWPGAQDLWTDWARGAPGAVGRAGSEIPRTLERAVTDVVYLPPTEPELEPARRDLAAACVGAGAAVVIQRRPGHEAAPVSGAVDLWDLLPTLLGPGRAEGWRVGEGAACVWPLIAGVTDGDELIEAGLARLARAGAAVVQTVVLELSAPVKRRLAESGDERTFDRLFHAPPPSERAFARRAAAHGLGSFVARPLPAGPPRLALRRRCAGGLRLAADLYRRLGRPEPATQRLLRAARWIDREDHDLAALVDDGNLAIVDWLDAASRGVVRELVAGRSSSLVESLLAEYSGPRRPEERPTRRA